MTLDEFVREFAAAKEGGISFADHGPIARGQMELEDRIRAIAEARGALIVQDTDLLSTVVYCDHYFGACPPWIAELARERKPAPCRFGNTAGTVNFHGYADVRMCGWVGRCNGGDC